MIRNGSKMSYDNRGSALITALVVSVVLMVLSLSLLAVSYSLFLSQKKNTSDTNERELLYSAIEVFEQELMNGGHKVFDEKATEKIKADNPDNLSLFGTKIVDSIFKYSLNDNTDASLKEIAAWKNFDLAVYNDKNSDEEKEKYIKDVSRFFNINGYGKYNIDIQMYWEYNSTNETSSDSTDSDKMKGILLHVIYRLKAIKNEDETDADTLIKNERIYRLGTSVCGTKIENDEADGQNGEESEGQNTDTDTTDYYALEFGGIRGQEGKYAVDPEFFQGLAISDDSSKYPYDNTKFPYIKIREDEFDDKLIEKYDCLSFLTIEGFDKWYCDSNKTKPWNGTYRQVWDAWNDSKKIRILRTDWNGMVPVRIKFIINGNYIDLDMYEYRYIKHVVNNVVVAGGEQPFISEDKLNNNFNDAFLEACGITITDTDNSENIIWKMKDGTTYYNFFNDDGKPIIKSESNTSIGKTYYVYATFPSYYKDDTYNSFINGFKLKEYDPEKTMGFNDVCSYNMYSFERIIGE